MEGGAHAGEESHGAVFYRYVGAAGLVPVEGDVVAGQFGHTQVAGTAGADIDIVEIEPGPAAAGFGETESYEVRIGRGIGEHGLHLLPGIVLGVLESFDGDEGAGVVGVVHHA